jgi:Holliday junction resolvase RusA-like endonuclease
VNTISEEDIDNLFKTMKDKMKSSKEWEQRIAVEENSIEIESPFDGDPIKM